MTGIKKMAGSMGLVAVVTLTLSGMVTAQTKDTRLTSADLEDHQKMDQLGLKYKTADDLFQALKRQAHGGAAITATSKPDWSGIYTREKGGTQFDPDGPKQGEYPSTAHFIPKIEAELRKTVADRKAGVEYDPLSQCNPPTYPRWLDLPFMKEFIVTPKETWMIAEAFNSIRRIYTDGRGHLSPDVAFNTEEGDSIGFWDGDRLIVHTTRSKAMMYERAQGWYTDDVQGVEIWHKVNPNLLVANAWIYDPNLLQPWYTRQGYKKIDAGINIRVDNWYCNGSANNDVRETSNGGSDYVPFTWEKKDQADKK